MLDQPLVFLDLETTGGSFGLDRIIEIGLVEVDRGELVGEWSTLVNPGRRIPHAIQVLTGITDDAVQAAPSFADVSAGLYERLQGKVLAAHNARFDYSFLKSEFQRAGLQYVSPVLCTVKLSRRLAPEHPRHNLDALIMRHSLFCLDRHRALGDARVLWELSRIWSRDIDSDTLALACADLLRRPAVPAALPPDLYDTLPEGPGAYVFYGERDKPLYAGRSGNVRSRVMAHFSGDRRSGKDTLIASAVKRVECHETPGELGAHLTAARLIAKLAPEHNRAADVETCSWLWRSDTPHVAPRLVDSDEIDDAALDCLYGAFRSRASARTALRELAKAYRLCHALLGLETPTPGSACSAHAGGHCRGACIGAELAVAHSMRAVQALSKLRVKRWPYAGAIAVRERDVYSERVELHVIDRWRYLGTAYSDGEARELAQTSRGARFDIETYRTLQRLLKAPPRHCDVVVYGCTPRGDEGHDAA